MGPFETIELNAPGTRPQGGLPGRRPTAAIGSGFRPRFSPQAAPLTTFSATAAPSRKCAGKGRGPARPGDIALPRPPAPAGCSQPRPLPTALGSEQEASRTREMSADSATAKAINASMRKAVPMADLEVCLDAEPPPLCRVLKAGVTVPRSDRPAAQQPLLLCAAWPLTRSPLSGTERQAPRLARQPPLAPRRPQVQGRPAGGQEGQKVGQEGQNVGRAGGSATDRTTERENRSPFNQSKHRQRRVAESEMAVAKPALALLPLRSTHRLPHTPVDLRSSPTRGAPYARVALPASSKARDERERQGSRAKQ